MFCSNCGQRLTDDAKHCPNCGMLIRRDTETQADPGRPEDPKGPEEYSYGGYTYSKPDSGQPAGGADPYGYAAGQTNAGRPGNGAYGYPAQPTKEDGYALTGLILAIVSGVCSCLPFIGAPCAVLGIIFSAKGLKSVTRRTMAVIGLILAIIFTVCNLVTGYSLYVGLANADSWADMLESYSFDSFEFRFR